VTDELNHPIDEPPRALEGGTAATPAGESPAPAPVPGEAAIVPPTADQPTADQPTADQPTADQPPADRPTAPVEPGLGEVAVPAGLVPEPPAPPAAEAAIPPEPAGPAEPAAPPAAGEEPSVQAQPADDSEESSVVAVRRATPKQSKTAGKKAKGEGKPASKRAAEVAVEAAPAGPKSENMNWYILKVQSNREDSIREGLLRRVAIAGLNFFFGEVIVPTEKVTEVKQGRKRVTKRKLYPGYLVVQMEVNEDTWFLIRETPGIGDFTGPTGEPTPMLPHEVNRILQRSEEKTDQAPKLDIRVHTGDRVKINEGTFENFEGEVDNIDATNGRVTVMINIFGRSTPVELEYWQIESL
jgi:transcriptional antiterminator NusG